jgi:predicted short-subunit dehydrogenase-like oxidoreductase (DUF2520 family)
MRPSQGMNVLLIGTGRVVFHLGHALKNAGVPIVGVAGRDATKANALATELATKAFPLKGPLPAADIRLIGVSDDAIDEVAAQLPKDGTITVHTSGARPLDLLKGHDHIGVLWPIQSLSPGVPADLSNVPLVIDASDESTLSALRKLAASISGYVVDLDHEKRSILHLAAVLAGNFPAFLLMQAERILLENHLDPHLVHPLWNTTAHKATLGAKEAVTGPARRGDIRTIAQHLDRLTSDPDLRRAYAVLSDLILRTYHPDKRAPQDLQGDTR